MNSFLKFNWPSILWAAFILLLCLLPGRDLPKVHIWNIDKVAHIGFYIVLSWLMFWGWQKQSQFAWPNQNTFIKILLIASAYGFLVEVLQHILTTDRYFDLYDALANAAGAVAGSFLYGKIKS